MRQGSNVVRRNGRYSARLAVPVELQRLRATLGIKGAPQKWRALETADPDEARRRAPLVIARMRRELDHEFAQLRARATAPQPDPEPPIISDIGKTPTDHELEAAAFRFQRDERDAEERARASDPSADDIARERAALAKRLAARTIADPDRRRQAVADILSGELPAEPDARKRERIVRNEATHFPTEPASWAAALELEALSVPDPRGMATRRAESRSAERKALVAALRENSFDLVDWAIEEIATSYGYTLPHGSEQRKKLGRKLIEMRIRALDAADAREAGDFQRAEVVELPQHANQTISATKLPSKAKPAESFAALLTRYLDETRATKNSKDVEHIRKRATLFAEFFGKARAVTDITRASIRDWKQLLQAYPSNARNRREFQGKTFQQIAALNRTLMKPTLSAATINNHISSMGGFLKWLAANGYVEDGALTKGLSLAIDREANARESFSDAELAELFKLPAFSGCESHNQDKRRGNVRLSDFRFWLPALQLYTGARPGELAQLRLADVRQVHGEWTINITTMGDDDEFGNRKRRKTKGSDRVVPLHPELQRLGFLKHVTRLRDAGELRLFPELKPDRYGSLAERPSRWFRKYGEHFGIKPAALYRFRHSFVDRLRDAGFTNDEIGPVIGHKDASMTEHYGALAAIPLRRRIEMVNAVSYPSISLTPPFSNK